MTSVKVAVKKGEGVEVTVKSVWPKITFNTVAVVGKVGVCTVRA